MPSFNLQHLKYFYDTIRLGGVSQAAQESHVSQSAVSQGIAKLEICLGKALLVHRKNRIQLTEEGNGVFAQAASVLKAVDELEESIHTSEGEFSGQIVVGCTHSLAQSLLVDLIHRLNVEAPKVTLKLRFGHTALVKQWLSEGSVDFGIALDNEDLSALETVLLYRGRFELFRDVSKTPPDKIREAIFSEPRPEVHMIKRAYHELFGTELVSVMEISSWEMIFSLVCGSTQIGFFPDYLMLHPERKGLLVPCDLGLPEVPYRLFLVRDRAVPLSRSTEFFFEMVKTRFVSKSLT
ncbi:MAG: LysR family transcriptional regulator [Chlamydiota bacterium]|nr:LysR family transcriptional regulator [Chlamydiota bacterium]